MKKVKFKLFVKDPKDKSGNTGFLEKGIHEMPKEFLEVENVLEFEDEDKITHCKITGINPSVNPLEVFVEKLGEIARIQKV